MLAGPASAQISQSDILGASGASACPSGQSEMRPNLFTVTSGPDQESVGLGTPALSSPDIRAHTSYSGSFFKVRLRVLDSKTGRQIRAIDLGEVNFPSPSMAAKTHSIAGLTQNTSYFAVLSAGNPNPNNRTFARICFRTAADLEIPFGSGRGGDGPGDSWSSGCYAFSRDRNQILACFCGARNSSGQWAWTDAEDGYEYMMEAAWRTRVGCSTN